MHFAFSWATRPATANGCQPGGSHAGGDIACAVAAPGAVRLLIGDAMGHDARAAATALAVADAFRRIAVHPDPLQVIAARLHAFVADRAADGATGEAADEEFVTAQFISIPSGDDGEPQIVCCGHPAPLLLRGGRVTPLDALPPSAPLGLLDLGDHAPRADLLAAAPGDGLLLYTDGVSEAYDEQGRLYPIAERVAALGSRSSAYGHDGRDESLPELLRDDLLGYVGGDLRDDATLLYLSFASARAGRRPVVEVPRQPAAAGRVPIARC
jgi:serine phosphatase RsbU (regulator of sigma subunit)